MNNSVAICYYVGAMLTKEYLLELYVEKSLSMHEIASKLGCSDNQVVYWMSKHEIPRRSLSDAIYVHSNPHGDPFKIKTIKTMEDAELLGIGIGLYWGEGNKRSKHSVRLGNTDPGVITTFIRFLVEICGIDMSKVHYGLQIFSDIDPSGALNFWMKELHADMSQFGKVIVIPARSIGNYRVKNQTGVLTVNFHNYKLQDIIVGMCRDSSVGRAHPW